MAAAEETASAAAPAEPKKRKMSGKKLVLFIVLPLLLLGGGGAAAYFLLLKKPPAAAEDPAAAEAASAEPGVFIDVPPIEANLESTGKRGNFLRLSLWLEVKNEAESKKIDGVMPRIIDQFQVYLRSLRIDDLQGADGVQRMRDELLMRARAAAKPVEIKDVLIKAMLAQ
jgi:flagellar FliL protein